MTDDLGIPPAELPRADSPGAPAGVTPVVARDIEADIAGEARTKNPSPPPPGTTEEKFWQRSGTAVAIAATIEVFQFVTRPYLISVIGAEGAVLAEVAQWAWAAALGYHKVAPGLRRK